MNSRMTELLQGMSVLISDAAAVVLVLAVLPLCLQLDFYVPIWLWLGILCGQFLIGYTLLSIGTSVNFYLIFQGIAMAGSCIWMLRTSYCNPGWENMSWFLGLSVLAVSAHCAFVSWRLPEANQILRYVDVLIVLLAFFLYTEFYLNRQASSMYTVLPLAAMLLNLWTISRLRTAGDQEHVIQGAGTGGKLLLAVIGAGCLLLTAAIVGFGSEEVHSTVDVLLVLLKYVWAVVTLFFRIVGTILAGILLFFIWLLPAAPRAARENVQVMVQENVEEMTELAERVIPLWVFAALGLVFALGLIGWILYQYRGKSLKRIRRVSRKRKLVRKSRLWEAVRAFLRKLADDLSFQWQYLRYRKTLQGLFVLAERTGRQKHVPRKKNESPGEYVRRLAEQTDEALLRALADSLDRIWYAGEEESLTREEYERYEHVLRQLEDEKDKARKAIFKAENL